MMAGPFALSAALLIQPFTLAGANKMAGPNPIRREWQWPLVAG
jgi:hypothetical protein